MPRPAAAAAGMTMGQSLLEELFPECKTEIMCRLVGSTAAGSGRIIIQLFVLKLIATHEYVHTL